MSLSDDNDDFENVPAMNELQKNKQYKSKDRKNPIIIDSNPERCPGQNTIPVTNSFPSYCARKQSGQNVSTKYEKVFIGAEENNHIYWKIVITIICYNSSYFNFF